MNMQLTPLNKLGWVLSACFVGMFLASGFQGSSSKFAVVNTVHVSENSKMGQKNLAQFNEMKAVREAVLDFIDRNQIATIEQAQELRELGVKLNLNREEQTRLEALKDEIVASTSKAHALLAKENLTEDEKTLLTEFARREQLTDQLAKRWYEEFTREMQDWATEQKRITKEEATNVVQGVARDQGYTLVFDQQLAPYGANDLTEATLKAMDEKQ